MPLSVLLKTSIKRGLNVLGYDVHKTPKPDATTPYEPAYPHATYAPWNTDREFREIYSRIRDNTLVDVYRCYELWTLVTQLAQLPEGIIIEVGVWRGGTGALIAAAARRAGITDRIYLCDTFEGVTKASDLDSLYKGGEHSDTSEKIVGSLLAGFPGLTDVVVLRGVFPEETARSVREAKIRMCHIDVDVYNSARDVFEWAWDRLVLGGVVVFDDYGFDGCIGVTRLVDGFRGLSDRVIIHNLNGHAVVVKVS